MKTLKTFFPTLSEDGWVVDSSVIVDYMFSHFFLSDYSQSQLYTGHITSFSWILQEHRGNMLEIIASLTQSLNTYFRRYFPYVDLEITESTKDSNSNNAAITLFLKIVDNEGKAVNLGRLVNLMNSKLNSIVKLSNDGTPIGT
jgi:hypothetical protein